MEQTKEKEEITDRSILFMLNKFYDGLGTMLVTLDDADDVSTISEARHLRLARYRAAFQVLINATVDALEIMRTSK